MSWRQGFWHRRNEKGRHGPWERLLILIQQSVHAPAYRDPGADQETTENQIQAKIEIACLQREATQTEEQPKHGEIASKTGREERRPWNGSYNQEGGAGRTEIIRKLKKRNVARDAGKEDRQKAERQKKRAGRWTELLPPERQTGAGTETARRGAESDRHLPARNSGFDFGRGASGVLWHGLKLWGKKRQRQPEMSQNMPAACRCWTNKESVCTEI